MEMETTSAVEMNDEELTELLGRGGTGVISFSTGTDTPPHSLPVSYGYNEASGDFYFHLAFPSDSAKEGLVEGPVSFATDEHADDGGGALSRSVVWTR